MRYPRAATDRSSYSRTFAIIFFKQKTAYEMRISAWSSDVCSSDLRLAEALGVPAMDLPFQQQAIDDHAEIVDDRVGHDLDVARLRIHLQLAHMGAVREGGRRRLERAALVEIGRAHV